MQSLIVSTFPNAKALPLWAAGKFGLFRARGLEVELHETGSSREQRAKLAAGEIHIVQAAVDNGLAMIAGGHDIVIVMGGEGGMNDFVVQPHIFGFDALAGQRLLVDSPDTAYALLARELLERHGLKAQVDYDLRPVGNGARRLQAMCEDSANAAAILNPPFTQMALQRGLVSLGRLDDLAGPYQAGGAFVRRDWAVRNGSTLEAYIGAYLDALDWLHARSNAEEGAALLAAKLALPADVARDTFAFVSHGRTGFTPRAAILPEGLRKTLDLRIRTFGGADVFADPANYLDLTWYRRSIAARTDAGAQPAPA